MTPQERLEIQQALDAIRLIEGGQALAKANIHLVGTGYGSIGAGSVEAAAAGAASVTGIHLVFLDPGVAIEDCKRLVYKDGRFGLYDDEACTTPLGLETRDGRTVQRGDGDPVTVSGAVDGANKTFTLLDHNGNPKKFRHGSVLLSMNGINWTCSLNVGAVETGTSFYLGADQYTITTAVAPTHRPIFLRGIAA